MNLSALPELLLSWLRNQGTESLQAGREANRFKPGQQYDAEVLSKLTNGRSLVKVGKETLDMPLPGGLRSGDTVKLTFLHAAPRPTFSVAQNAAQAAQPVRVSDPAAMVTALVRYAQSPAARVAEPAAASGSQPAAASTQPAAASAQPAATAPRPIVPNANLMLSVNNVPANLGAALASRVAIPGMTLGGGQAVEGMRAAMAPNTNLAAQGVTEAPLPDAHILPLRLRQVLSESGMFYESHLARWIKGQLTMESLQREPQARLARQDIPQAGMPELKGMSDEAARLAGRQLVLLDGGPFVWQGQAWPGQALEWRVEEEADGGKEAGEEGPAWRTDLRLTLPRLGEVRASLRLTAAGIDIGLAAASPETLAEIRVRLSELADQLRQVRIKPLGVQAQLIGEEAGAPA